MNHSRRNHQANFSFIIFLILTLMLQNSCIHDEPIMKIGLVADPQYADKPPVRDRYYKKSLWKLKEAIDTFNQEDVDFVQNLGDIIDEKWESFDAILPIYKNLLPQIKNYHLLGNHDFSIDTNRMQDLLAKLSMPDYYYSYSINGWRFIILDATEYSFYTNPLHKNDLKDIEAYYNMTKSNPNHKLWNSAIGQHQQKWLKSELDLASRMKQKVIIFSHLPLRPLGDSHNLWNDYEIIKLIESKPNVIAYINGHNHAGNYIYKNGVHYITLFGMVDTQINSYGILMIYKNRIVLHGYGNQESIEISFN